MKERNPEIRIIGADPEGSVLSGGAPKAWKVEGIGEDFVPKTFNGQMVDGARGAAEVRALFDTALQQAGVTSGSHPAAAASAPAAGTPAPAVPGDHATVPR